MRIARLEGLLGRIANDSRLDPDCVDIPAAARDRLTAARAIADSHSRMIHWEVDRIRFALRKLDTPILLLKGAAYLLAGLSLARGRLVSDVDILVPESALDSVETELLAADWVSLKIDQYDQEYYRRWMHELPPMRHRTRGTVVDVHHRILPQTSRLQPDPGHLWKAAVFIEEYGVYVLSPADMLLHCAAHLFHDGDMNHGLRDLVDLHDMFSDFGTQPDFWSQLIERARLLGLERPLFYAARYTRRVLQTPIPDHFLHSIDPAGPPRPVRRIMDRLVMRVMQPEDPDKPGKRMALARWLLYIRSHYLRMPLYLLIPHLLRKSLRKQAPTS